MNLYPYTSLIPISYLLHVVFFFFNVPAPPEISPLPLPAALPISAERLGRRAPVEVAPGVTPAVGVRHGIGRREADGEAHAPARCSAAGCVLSAAFSAVSNTRRASNCVSAMSRAARQWRA